MGRQTAEWQSMFRKELKMTKGIRDKIAIIGMGCVRFGENWKQSAADMIIEAAYEAYDDAGIDPVEIQAACRDRAGKLDVRLAWERSHEKGHFMQLHPADTGGSFFEIDWDEKNEHTGHWTPAGGDGWEKAVHRDIVSDIKAAELQSPDPEPLARRWSAIAGIPLQTSSAGHLEIPLNNAAIRFVEATDGRGEGLGGIDVVVTDRARLLKAADERKLKTSENQVMICGVRFNLV